ncbi:hypothetical protein CPB97_005445, partial [Podila verticillata]
MTNEGQAQEQTPVVLPENIASNAPAGKGKPEPKIPQTPLVFSYSQMVKRNGGQHQSKTTTKEIWKNIRAARTTVTSADNTRPPVFIRSNKGFVAAIVFGFSGVRADLMHSAILNMKTGGQHLDFDDDRALIHFDNKAAYQSFLERTVEVGDLVFKPQETLFTTGKPLLIRAHHVTHGTNEERKKALQDIFNMAGTIRHIDFHVVQSGMTTMTTPIVDFVLDITCTNPDQASIPRLANVSGINCLFTWANMGEVCYQCGDDKHVKARCTQQEHYARAPAILLPQLSRAFPPTTPKNTQQTTTPLFSSQSVNYGPAPTSSSPPSSSPSVEGEWQTQGRKYKTTGKRPTISASSDNETPPTPAHSRKKLKNVHKTTKPKETDATKSKAADRSDKSEKVSKTTVHTDKSEKGS